MNSLLKSKQKTLGNCHDEPVMLFLQDGGLLNSIGHHCKQGFSTKFFLITKIDEKKGCVSLRLLKPCHTCCHPVLALTESCLTIDMDCICGVQFFPHIPIRDCDHEPIGIKDCICGPFAILPKFEETVLWTANLRSNLEVSLKICIEEGDFEGLELKVYNSNGRKAKTYPICEKKQEFCFKGCKKISLIKPNSSGRIKGLLEIEVSGDIDNDVALNSWP